MPITAAAAYCGADSGTVLALHEFFAPALAEMAMEPLLRDIEMPLVRVLADMEWEGISIDPAVFARLNAELSGDLRRLEGEIAAVAGEALNLNSPRQLATILFEKQQLPVLKRTKTGPSTDADVLEQLAAMGHELPRLILEYRELQKLKSTYVDTLPTRVNRQTGRIHTSFNQTGAATRPAQLGPSPTSRTSRSARARGEAIRRGFVPRAGWQFLVADYSQIELRLMAHLSGDAGFIEAFRQGGDIHRQTAALIFGVPLDAGDARHAGARQDDQLRHHLRAGPVRAEPPARHLAGGREDLHRALLRALRRGARSSSTAWCSSRASRATSRRSSSAAATSPRSRTATSTCAPTASAPRRTRRSRARRPT